MRDKKKEEGRQWRRKNMKFSFSGAQRVVDEGEKKEKGTGATMRPNFYSNLSLWLLVSSACGDFVPFCRGRERLEFFGP